MGRLWPAFSLNMKGNPGAGKKSQVQVVRRLRGKENTAHSLVGTAPWFHQRTGQGCRPGSGSHHLARPPLIPTQLHKTHHLQSSCSKCFGQRVPEVAPALIAGMGLEPGQTRCSHGPDPADHTHLTQQQWCSSQQPPGRGGEQGPFPLAAINSRNYFNPHVGLCYIPSASSVLETKKNNNKKR